MNVDAGQPDTSLVPMALGSVCGRKIGRKIEKVAATTDSTSIGTYNFVHLDPETMRRLGHPCDQAF